MKLSAIFLKCSNEEYLGRVNQLFNSNVCLIEDSLDEVAATLDLGLAKVRLCYPMNLDI